MSLGKVANYLFIFFIATVSGRPQNEAVQPEENPEPLPFLQFTNGGLRVNFGGYHAEAGLGGLLRGTGTGGGLHASVGTPWGGHAGAGLGGQVGGNDGTLGGGLYARAGLGRGRPEAAAGLGGRLNGRSMNPISGGMYAGATPGGGPGPGVFLGGGVGAAGGVDVAGGVDGFASGSATKEADLSPRATGDAATGADAAASADGVANETKPKKGYTNIQIIPSREKNAQKKNEKLAFEVTASADTSADGKTKSQDKEVRRAINAEVGLVKSAYIGTAPVVGVVKSVEKQVVVPAVAAPTQAKVQANATTNVVAIPDINQDVGTKTVYPPRWYFRKRFWTVPRKTVYVGPSAAVDTQSSPSDVVGALFANAVGNDGGAIAASKTYTSGGAITASKTYTGGSLFDDIFNIPISTLAAVNQLLKNNVG